MKILTIRNRRWSDNDFQFLIFTFSLSNSYKPIGIVIDSGGGEEPTGCHFRLNFLWLTMIIELPPIIPSHRKKVYADWDTETVNRLGRNWYYDEHPRAFGFSYCYESGFLQVFYGAITHDSETDKTWCAHLPFQQWRFARQSWLAWKARS